MNVDRRRASRSASTSEAAPSAGAMALMQAIAMGCAADHSAIRSTPTAFAAHRSISALATWAGTSARIATVLKKDARIDAAAVRAHGQRADRPLADVSLMSQAHSGACMMASVAFLGVRYAGVADKRLTNCPCCLQIAVTSAPNIDMNDRLSSIQ